MTDNAPFDVSSDGERLSAYLAGELDDVAARRLEHRLAQEPELARQLDALADALLRLGAVDDAEEPPGLADRLQQRLAAERDRGGASVSDDGRGTGPGWLAGLGAVAAVLVAVAVVSSTLLGGGGDVAMDSAGTDDSAESAVEGRLDTAVTESADEAEQPTAADDADVAAGAGVPVPLILDADPVQVRGERALRRRYRNLPEVQALLGVSIDEAAELAGAHTARIREYSYESDDAPADCLSAVTTGATSPLVPARVERLVYADQPAVAYVMVTASPDAGVLDRVEVWVVEVPGCTTLVFQQL